MVLFENHWRITADAIPFDQLFVALFQVYTAMESQMVQNSRNKIGLTFNKIIIKVKTDFSQAQQNQFTFNKTTSSLSRNYLSRARDIWVKLKRSLSLLSTKNLFQFHASFHINPKFPISFNNLTFQGQAANAVNNPILCQQPCQALYTK